MNALIWFVITICVFFLILAVFAAIAKSKCPLCGSKTIEWGYSETLHCTECPWSEIGPDFEFAKKYKEDLKRISEEQEKMVKIAEEVKKQRLQENKI